MIYAGYHIVLQGGSYVVYEKEDPTHGYLGRTGTFNTEASARGWVRALNQGKRERALSEAMSDRFQS